jgi:basic membrane lipoprotein Med (substrate-binding protein (PBP1-ABC) superfamily)
MREYATQGNQLIVGESFAVEAAAHKVAKDFPNVAFLMGSSGKPQAPNFSVFDNYVQEPAYMTGMIADGMTESDKIGLVGGFPIPEVNRLMNDSKYKVVTSYSTRLNESLSSSRANSMV